MKKDLNKNLETEQKLKELKEKTDIIHSDLYMLSFKVLYQIQETQ